MLLDHLEVWCSEIEVSTLIELFQKLPAVWGCALKKCLPALSWAEKVLILRGAKLLTCPVCPHLGPALITVGLFRTGAGMHLDVCWRGAGNTILCLLVYIKKCVAYFTFMLLLLSS